MCVRARLPTDAPRAGALRQLAVLQRLLHKAEKEMIFNWFFFLAMPEKSELNELVSDSIFKKNIVICNLHFFFCYGEMKGIMFGHFHD